MQPEYLISAETYASIRERLARYETWRHARFGNGWASYHPEEVPENARVSNDETSAVEVYDWHRSPPESYFLYVNREKRLAQTWTGQRLGTVEFGRSYHDNFGGERVSIIVCGDNGRDYHGTYFKSSGDYARIRMLKRSKQAA